MKKIILSLLLLNTTKSLIAQTQRDTMKAIELPASVVKAFSNKLSVENQGIVRLKKGSTMDRIIQVQDVPYLLNEMSSIVASSDAGTGTGYTGIRIRGTDLTRINVTMNGIPVNDPESQATYFVNTPDLISSMQQIEVSKGIGNSKNGNGSFGGAIAFNTLDVNDKVAKASFQTDFGSFNTMRATAKVSTGLLHNKFTSTLRASAIKSDGYIDRSAASLKSIQFTLKYIIDKSSTVIFNYLKGNEKTGLAWNGVPQDSVKTNRRYNELGLKSDGSFYKNQSDNYGQDYYQLFYDKKINTQWHVGSTLFYTKGKGYYEEYKMKESYSSYGLPNFIVGNDTITSTDIIRQLWLDNDYYGARLYANYFSKKIDAGLYFNYNEYKGKHFGEIVWAEASIPNNYRWYNLNAQKNELNVYGMFDYKFAKDFSMLVDAQYRHINYTINGFRKNPNIQHDLQFDFFNPKIKVSYNNGKHLAYAYIGQVSKEPNRDDIEANANNLPKPEKLTNVEFHYSLVTNSKCLIRATAYWMNYKNQLILTGKINDVGAYTRSNVAQSYRAGIELENEWRFKLISIAANVTLSQNKINESSEFIDDYDNGGQLEIIHYKTDISFSPSIIAGGRISIFPMRNNITTKFKDASIDILPKYVGKQFLDNTSNKQRMLDAYFTSNMILNVPCKIQQNVGLNLRLGINNIFNTLYSSNGYSFCYIYENQLTTSNYVYPQAGRQVMLGLGIDM